MPVEEILTKIDKQRESILLALYETDKLVKELKDSNVEQYDWISVKEASKLMDVSVNAIYNKINLGYLDVKHFGGKKFIKRSQITVIDDDYKRA